MEQPAILVVDDHRDNLVALDAVLSPLGYPVVKALSGEEALKKVLEQQFALILLDVQMPGLDGFETARLIRQHPRSKYTPIIFISAIHRDHNHVLEGYSTGSVDYLVKPFEPDILRFKAKCFLELHRQSARARREAEAANRARYEFLASVSHELRGPLNAILGWARMARSGMLEKAKLEHALEIIERNAQRQKELIEDILDISRIITGKLRIQTRRISYMSIINAALEMVQPAAEAKQIQLLTDLDPLADEAAGDPDRLQQVVWNLFSNAIKFTGKGGEVRVGLRQVEGDIEINVSDTGRGIRPDFLPLVFNSFRQAEPVSTRGQGGLGLGLAITQHLVELHGGWVRAESGGEGKGATFIVRLPRRLLNKDLPEPSWMLPADSHPEAISLQLNGVNVLFVDDQADARELVKELLELHGAKVTSVETAERALEAIQEHTFHVLLSDIGMPMIDGYELIRQIRKLPPEQGGRIPAVAVTGFARSEDSQRALAEGFQNHLSKPIEPKELVDLVASLSTAQPH
jgi:signal transduction histidine kinase